ncbi:MAG: hypothetical protein HYR56_31940 [Acidobacteria bacterium]|nr:hypothetical protein [Acidobacteriota bacterium]MBI3424307.1 hypothetical protein [Acidobacteriota bacterium]
MAYVVMQKEPMYKIWLAALLLSLAVAVIAQQTDAPRPAAGLPQTYAQLKTATESDLLLVLSEPTVNQAAQSLTGMEFTLANGALLRIKTITARLTAAGAEVKLEVLAFSSATSAKALNLRLTGIMNNAEPQDGALRLPFRLTEVALDNGVLTPLLRLWFGEWLSPERWNAALPALTVPREVAETLDIPAAQFEVGGSLPMTVTTKPYQLPLPFTLSALCILEGRAVVGLRLAELTNEEALSVNSPAAAALPVELARLSEQLGVSRSLRARLSRRLLSQMLLRLAAARTDDIQMLLRPGRVREEAVDGLVKVTNYTDLESGNAQADVQQFVLDRIDAGGLTARLRLQGVFDTRLRGREYGIPYRIAPHGTFAINDRPVPLRVTSTDGRAFLQATPGTQLLLDLRFQLGLVGREIGFNRQANLPAERLLNHLELPAFYLRKLPLPYKLAVNQQGKLDVVERQERWLELTGLQISAQSEALEINGDVLVKAR